MDGERLQQRVYSGYEKAARRVGLAYSQYRPTTATNPISSGFLLGEVKIAVTSDGFAFNTHESHGENTANLLADGRELEVGDYLVRGDRTYFVGSMGHIRPIMAVRCNEVLTLKRPAPPLLNGLNTYGGDIRPDELIIATAWPASSSMLGNGKTNEPLPSDAGTGRRRILLPAIPGVTVLHSDIFENALTQRYTVMSAELTELGWRVDTMQAVA